MNLLHKIDGTINNERYKEIVLYGDDKLTLILYIPTGREDNGLTHDTKLITDPGKK